MAYVSKVQTAKTPTGTLKDKEKELNEGERTADFQGTLTYDTEPIVQPMLSRFYSKPDLKLTYPVFSLFRNRHST